MRNEYQNKETFLCILKDLGTLRLALYSAPGLIPGPVCYEIINCSGYCCHSLAYREGRRGGHPPPNEFSEDCLYISDFVGTIRVLIDIVGNKIYQPKDHL